jgi:hypothetical protein
VAAFFSTIALVLLGVELGVYAVAAATAAIVVTRHRDEPAGLIPRVLVVFPIFHLAHGLGTVCGFAAELAGRRPKPGSR